MFIRQLKFEVGFAKALKKASKELGLPLHLSCDVHMILLVHMIKDVAITPYSEGAHDLSLWIRLFTSPYYFFNNMKGVCGQSVLLCVVLMYVDTEIGHLWSPGQNMRIKHMGIFRYSGGETGT